MAHGLKLWRTSSNFSVRVLVTVLTLQVTTSNFQHDIFFQIFFGIEGRIRPLGTSVLFLARRLLRTLNSLSPPSIFEFACATAGRDGVIAALGVAEAIGKPMRMPWLMMSVNDDEEDPHFRKAAFDPNLCPAGEEWCQ